MCCTMRLCIYNVCLYTPCVYVLYSLYMYVLGCTVQHIYCMQIHSIASVLYARLYTCVHIHSSMCMFNAVCTHVYIYAQCVCFMQYYTHLYFYTPYVFYAHVCMCTLQDTVCGEYISYSNTHCVCGDTHCVHGTMCAHMFMLHTHLFMSVSACVCVGRHPDHTGLSDRGSHIGQD